MPLFKKSKQTPTKSTTIERRPDAIRVFTIGNSGGGKSSFLKELLKKYNRVIVLDPKAEYYKLSFTQCHSQKEFIQEISKHSNSEKVRLSFVGMDIKDFDFFCKIAFLFNQQRQSLVICEELTQFCSRNTLSPNGKRLLNQMRSFGGMLAFTTQRPQEVPKGIIANVNIVNIYQTTLKDDRQYLERNLSIPIENIPSKQGSGVQLVNGVINKQFTFKYIQNNPVFYDIKKSKRLNMNKQGLLL